MPRYDGTGPAGNGPMTGRAMGPCGRGVAWSGAGRGWRVRANSSSNTGKDVGRWPWWIQSSDSKTDVLKSLEAEKAEIEAAIDNLKKSE